MPQAAKDAYPELWIENERYKRVFWLLHRRRPEGFAGLAPVPIQDIAVVADRLGFDFETLLGRVTACDEEVRKWLDSNKKRGSANDGPRTGPPERSE